MLLFTSCENFLKGANVRQELEEAIEIANASPVTYYVIADQGSGTVTSNQLRLKKKESFDIMFIPNDGWKFIGWEVLDRDTDEVVENSISFKDAKALETKGTVLAARENLYIHPKCVMLPTMISHSPNDENQANYANTPIIINFNMELQEENFATEGSLSNYNYISITQGNNSLTKYFENPALNADKTSVTIMPKTDDFIEYIKKNGDEIDIVVELKETLHLLAQAENLPVNKTNLSFTVKYLADKEHDSPQEIDNSFFVARPDDLDHPYVLGSSGIVNSSDNIKRNRTKGTVFIYGKYSDTQSGVKTVVVNESRYYTIDATQVQGEDITPKEYTAETEGATFVTNGNVTEFFITHEVKSKPGVLVMKVEAYAQISWIAIVSRGFAHLYQSQL